MSELINIFSKNNNSREESKHVQDQEPDNDSEEDKESHSYFEENKESDSGSIVSKDQIELEEIFTEEEENLSVEERLNKGPPDFEWAKRHGEANMVKPILEGEELKNLDDKELFGECCHRPTHKSVKKYRLCVRISELKDLGVGVPLYFNFKFFNIVMYFLMSLLMIYPIVDNYSKEEGWGSYYYDVNYLYHPIANGYFDGNYTTTTGICQGNATNNYEDYYGRTWPIPRPMVQCDEWYRTKCESCFYFTYLYVTDNQFFTQKPHTVSYKDSGGSEDNKSRDGTDEKGDYGYLNNYKDDRSIVRNMIMREYRGSLVSYEKYEIILQQFGACLGILIIIGGSLLMKVQQQKMINSIDKKNITPSDYGVFVSNLPVYQNPQKVKAWFQSKYQDIEIVKVIFCYDVSGIIELENSLKRYKKMRSYLRFYKRKILKENQMEDDEETEVKEECFHPKPRVVYGGFKKHFIKAKLLDYLTETTEKRLLKLIKQMNQSSKHHSYSGNAFMILSRQADVDRLIKDFDAHPIKQLYSFISNRILCCDKLRYTKNQFKGQNVSVERAEEPADYRWENLSLVTEDRIKRGMVTFFLNFFLLAVSLIIYNGVYSISLTYLSNRLKNLPEKWKMIVTRIALTVNSWFVMFVNAVLGRISSILSHHERHDTLSKNMSSEAFKLTTVLFINSCGIPILLNFLIDDGRFFENLAGDIYSIAVGLGFYDPILQFFDITWFYKKYRMRKELKRGERSNLSQREANKLFEGNSFYISERYSKTMLLFLLACFFSYPVPLIPVVAFFGGIFQYMVEKFLLLRRNRLPEQMGAAIAQTFNSFLASGCILFSLSLIIFPLVNFDDKYHFVIGVVFLVISIVYLLSPFNTLIAHLTRKKKKIKTDQPTYEEASLYFLDDYERSNPLTKKEASLEHLLRLVDAGKITPTEYELRKQEIERVLESIGAAQDNSIKKKKINKLFL